MRAKTPAKVAAMAAATGLLVSGCQFSGVYNWPLPGGVSTGSHPYNVRIQFSDVSSLVPQSQCRVNNVPVGRVTSVQLQGWHALVTCKLRGSVVLPANTVATIDQTSLLGEKFVSLSAPTQPGGGNLHDGSLITLGSTSEGAQVEQVLSAMSMLVNGGGLEQVSTITQELNNIMGGREDTIRDVLRQVNTFVGGINTQKSAIVTAITNLNGLIGEANKQRGLIGATIDQTTPAVGVLESQRTDLTNLLTAFGKLSTVSTSVINASATNTVSILQSIGTIFGQINKAGSAFPQSLPMLLSFPFPDSVMNALRGDYGNVMLTLDLDLSSVSHNLLAGTPFAGLLNLTQSLQNLISPPNTGFPTTPLGVLPQALGNLLPGGVPATSSPTPSPSPSKSGGGLGGILPPLGAGQVHRGSGGLPQLLTGGLT